MKFRKLRITWTVFCGIAGLLLFVMEERSWTTTDAWSIGQMLYIASAEGDFAIGTLAIPYWLAIAMFASLAAIPLIRWRFSLRTLLVAITAVAVVLGLIVWLVR